MSGTTADEEYFFLALTEAVDRTRSFVNDMQSRLDITGGGLFLVRLLVCPVRGRLSPHRRQLPVPAVRHVPERPLISSPSMCFLLAFLLAIVAAPASAETFTSERLVTPPPLSEPAVVAIELTPDLQSETGYRIVTQTGFAVGFRADDLARDLMPQAKIAVAPGAADTWPRTNPSMIRDEGVFQPVTASTHMFRFTFIKDITPVELNIGLASGNIHSIEVKGGFDTDSMKHMFAGPAYGGTRVQLSGERVRVIDVILNVEGVVKIDTIRLLDTPRFLFFRAVPGKTYKLLSGGEEGSVAAFPGSHQLYSGDDPTRLARVGPAAPVKVQDDHDGVPPEADNCPNHWNWHQEDSDKDGTGDVCDVCPTVQNGEDANGNGQCDALEDPDMDGIINMRDNCPGVLNRLQEDEDADGIGNMCDDTDNRFSADKPWLPWFGMAVMVVSLMGVAALSVRKRK